MFDSRITGNYQKKMDFLIIFLKYIENSIVSNPCVLQEPICISHKRIDGRFLFHDGLEPSSELIG